MGVAEKAVSNTIYLFLNWFVMTLLSFFYWIIAGKTLLPAEYGKVTTSYQLMFLLGSLSNIGLGAAVSKLIPEYLAKGEEGKVSSLIKFSLKISLTLSTIIAIMLIILSSRLSPYLKLDTEIFFIVAFGIVASQLSAFFRMVWYGYQNMKKILKNNVVNQTIKVGLAALLVLTGWRYFGPIFAMAFSFLVSFLLYFSKKILKRGKRIDGRKILLTFAIPAFMANLAWLLFNNTQYIVLSLLKTTEVTGIFSVAFLICSQLAPIPGILTQAMFPLISQLSAKKDKLRQSLLISTAFKYTLIIGLPLISVFILFRNFLILLISRTEYLGGGEYFLLLAPSALLFGLGRLFLVNIYALGESKVYRNISVLIAISYLILSIILTIPYSGFGLALSYFFTSLLFFTLSISFFHRKVKIKVEMNTILKIIFCSLLFSLISYLIDITSNGMITKVIAMLANFAVYGILILKFVFDERDVRILKIIARKVGGNKLVKLVERLS